MKYIVYASLKEDINEGSCWITQPQLGSRSIVCISNPTLKKKVYCEALHIESNYLKLYNERHHTNEIDPKKIVIVINEWYRTYLGGFETKSEQELTIEPRKSLWAKFCACIQHPQIVVRLATWLGLIGLVLGVVGLVLGMIPLIK